MKTDTTKQSGTFVNTRMKSLFIAQDKKPATLREISLARLTPFSTRVDRYGWNRHAIH